VDVHSSAQAALLTVVPLAVVAALLRTVTWGGALAGIVVGGVISLAFGLGGLACLAVFFVGGSAATKVGWKTKTERGTAEAGGGARDARRIAGKGVVATLVAAGHLAGYGPGAAFAGAVAASLADTLGTEIGTLAQATPRSLPLFRPVPAGTPGAVSWPGSAAGLAGGALVAATAAALGVVPWELAPAIAVAGALASLVESFVVGLSPGVRAAPGWVRNLVSTGAGALLGAAALWATP
jgi:uncharacterized protein (TIGR00297 family)